MRPQPLSLTGVAGQQLCFSLDEIGNISADMQIRLLRFLEDRKIRPIGGLKEKTVNCRVLAATNSALVDDIKEGRFREDLYYRLKVVDLHIPPLREHKEDIPELVGMFVRENNAKMGINIEDVTTRAMQSLMEYHWPGNIRQLRHVIDRGMLFCDEAALDIAHLPDDVIHPKEK